MGASANFAQGGIDAQIYHGCVLFGTRNYTQFSYAALASASSAVSPQGISSGTIVVGPGESIQAAVNKANPGDTVLVKPGVYHQSVQIRTDGITLRARATPRTAPC
jgi:pectin methylesterase-like acyl-CoA thioesterase